MSKYGSGWATVERAYRKRRNLWFCLCPLAIAGLVTLVLLRVEPIHLWGVLLYILVLPYLISLGFLVKECDGTKYMRKIKHKYKALFS